MTTRSNTTSLAIVATALIALAAAIAGCGGGSGYGGSAFMAEPASADAATSVKLASTNLGKLLVDA